MNEKSIAFCIAFVIGYVFGSVLGKILCDKLFGVGGPIERLKYKFFNLKIIFFNFFNRVRNIIFLTLLFL